MGSPVFIQHVGWQWLGVPHVLLLLGLALFLSGCDPGGNQGSLSSPDASSPQGEQQAVDNLLALYREAVLAEDIDRLQALLQPEPTLTQTAGAPRTARQEPSGAFADLAAFRQALSDTFLAHAVTALEIPETEVVLAPDRGSVTFLEVESTLDPAHLTQATRVFRTTWQLARSEAKGVVTFRIAAVTRPAPLVEVHTPGLLLAGPPAPVAVRAASPAFTLAAVDLTAPGTGASERLTATAGQVHGTFTSPAGAQLHAVQVRALGADGTALVFTHRYRLHQAREGIAQRLAGTGTTRFLAVTVAPDGTVWAGGDAGGRLYRVAPASTSAAFVGALLDDPEGRVEDVLIDAQGRLHVVVVGPQRAGVIVREAEGFCQTVNVVDAAYPLLDGEGQPSPSTRAVAGANGRLVLAGSDGGVVAVRETFPAGQCAQAGGTVAYDPALRRQTSALSTNTVPALVVGQDGALWLGTALGLTRLHQGQFTRVPFDTDVSVQGDAATLEAFFQEVAAAIFAARPLETVALGDVSFVEAFGQALRKEDLIFNVVEAAPGTLWVGTLGGGLRRVEVQGGVPRDTLHLTRQDGLGSNVVLALAVGPDGVLWVGTDEGLSRVRPQGESVEITNFSALEGVPGPVRKVAVDAVGAVWLATDEGLFRLHPASLGGGSGSAPGAPQGQLIPVAGNNQSALPGQELPTPLVVRLEDQFGRPVAGEPVTATLQQGAAVFLSAATTVTDAQGEARFRLAVGQSATDLVVEVAAPARPEVAPVQFLAIIGAVDTPGVPLDVAVAGDLVFVAAHSGGSLQVIDARDPTHPVYLHQATPVRFPAPGTTPRAVALQGTRAYVATAIPPRLHIVDITTPRAATFPADTNGDGASDVILRSISLPATVGSQTVRAVAVQGDVAYVVTNSFGTAPGTLQVVRIGDPATAAVVQSLPLSVPRPTGLAVVGAVMYVPAGTAGLLVFDLRDPARPVLAATLGDPDPRDAVTTEISSGIAQAGDFAYLVETHRQGAAQDDRFTVLDLQDPLAPRRRGAVALPVVSRSASSTLGTTGDGLTVVGGFAYLTRGTLGLQVVDIRHPDAPRLVGLLDTPSQASLVTTADDRLYVLDLVAGLQVVQGAGADLTDTDGDGVIDFFDAFPADAHEAQDTDGDGLGNQTDADADNDGVADAAEQQATPPTDPADARRFPVRLPPAGTTTLVVDAASTSPASQRNGTPATPYRALSEALQALHTGQLPEVHTVQVRAGTYAALTTQEIFPLNLSGLAGLTLQGEGTVVIDAGLTAAVFQAEFSRDLVIEGFEITRGVHGIAIQAGTNITIRENQIREQSADGINIGGASTGVVIADNLLADNDRLGLFVFGAGSEATVRHNTMRHNGRHGLAVSVEAHATIADNLSEGNVELGMVLDSNAAATITNNTARQNGSAGFLITLGSTAELMGNTSTDNNDNGFSIQNGSTATLMGNTSSNNAAFGVVIGNGQNTVTLTGNVIEQSAFDGILSFTDDPAGNTLIMQENTVRQNVGNGMVLFVGTTATISGGLITQNGAHGIVLGQGATATIGLEGTAELIVSHNGAAGIFVIEDGASAQMNSGRIRFEANRTGAHVGVTDVIIDADGDGLDDADEATRGTDSHRDDTDGDGLRDGFEVRYGFDPLDPRDGRSDPDSDGLTNVDEQAAGTDPRLDDTDGDGLTDDEELLVYDTDPTQADTDQGGLTDGEEVALGTEPLAPDSDGDGVRDGVEIAARSDPLDAQSVPTALVYGTNPLRNVLLGLNPDTGQAAVLGSLNGDPNPTTGVPSLIFEIAWSPDGRTLHAHGFDVAAELLHTLHPDTGAILTTVEITLDPPGGFPIALGVDASGGVLATVCCTGPLTTHLGRFDPATGVLTRLGSTGFNLLVGLHFDPDFRTLYAITGTEVPPVLVAIDPATGQGTAIARTDLPTRALTLAFTADGRLVVAGIDANLYQLDPRTGASTLIGSTGAEFIVGITLWVLR